MNVSNSSQHWQSHCRWIIETKSLFKKWVQFEMNVYSSDNIEDDTKNEEFIPRVHSKIQFTEKRMYVTRGNIEDYMRNE